MTTITIQNKKEIEEAINKYTNCLTQTNQRRELWKTETKDKIVKILTLIEKRCNFVLVHRLEDLENYQAINLRINPTHSGIADDINKKTGRKSYGKHSGYLQYGQLYNGKISVHIGFPYIDKWVLEKDRICVETIEPREITEEKISQHIIKFFEAMSKWEGEDRLPIGYKIVKSN